MYQIMISGSYSCCFDWPLLLTLCFYDSAGPPSAPVNLRISESNNAIANDSITVRLDWSPPVNDGNISYQVTVDNATEVMYSDGTIAFVTLNSSGQYHVNITALNCVGSSPALSGVINIINTGSYCIHSLGT